MKTHALRFPVAVTCIVLAAAAMALAGCGSRNQADTSASGSGTPAVQQQAIQQNLAARDAYAKSRQTPGAQPN